LRRPCESDVATEKLSVSNSVFLSTPYGPPKYPFQQPLEGLRPTLKILRNESPLNSIEANRRSFLRRAGAISLGLVSGIFTRALAGTTDAGKAIAPSPAETPKADAAVTPSTDRANLAFSLRQKAAENDRVLPVTRPIVVEKNSEETSLPALAGSYSKCLPHDDLGQVNKLAYQTYLSALASGKPQDFEKIPMGGYFTLSNPMAAYSYNLDACDSSQIPIASPPAFSSAEIAAEMAELYWMALLRDVPFFSYGSSEEIAKAGTDLGKHLSGYADRKESNGVVSPSRIFRDGTAKGSLPGPYISQFLWLEVPYGASKIPQKYRFPASGEDFLTDYSAWLRNQRGFFPDDAIHLDAVPRYIRTGRDLIEYVHRDFSYQAFLNAALIALGAAYAKHEPRAPFSRENPYVDSLTQTGFSTFGGPNVLELIPRAASIALRASWYQKWLVFRRLRPQEFGGRVQNHLAKKARYPIHEDMFASEVLEKTRGLHKSWLLPQAYPEGTPTHPAFPAGHAVLAGAGATIIKAFFDESYQLPNPVQPSEDGLSLKPYQGAEKLTLGNEIDKLAANIGLGRCFAGIHWRSDSREGLRVGEASAISLLKNLKNTTREGMDRQFKFTSFEGNQISI
jgi:membrane-associated phospholipid phosphatase